MKIYNKVSQPTNIWLVIGQLTKKIDLDGTDFVALTKFLNASLWTGDKLLYNGLINLNFKNVLNTPQLLAIKASQSHN
ncbi:MAG: hypothetical protein EAY66_06090 [Sphingobacteriales bacterium]|nr:MAG: hypothetical protein EAY66_06090 [Sphingobacteriales bacterium]